MKESSSLIDYELVYRGHAKKYNVFSRAPKNNVKKQNKITNLCRGNAKNALNYDHVKSGSVNWKLEVGICLIFLEHLISCVVRETGSKLSRKLLRAAGGELGQKGGLWMSKIRIEHFSIPGTHANRGSRLCSKV